MWTGRAGGETIDLPIKRQPVLPPELRQKLLSVIREILNPIFVAVRLCTEIAKYL